MALIEALSQNTRSFQWCLIFHLNGLVPLTYLVKHEQVYSFEK